VLDIIKIFFLLYIIYNEANIKSYSLMGKVLGTGYRRSKF